MNDSTEQPAIDPTLVADYLKTNPDFFNAHPELLLELSLPHPTGQAVSLWERQNAALREEAERLRTRLGDFLQHARHNEALSGRLQQLVLAVLATREASELFALLNARLAEEFNADRVTGLVFAAHRAQDNAHFVGRDSSRRDPFAELLGRREAQCGRLNQAQRAALFGEDAMEGSHVVLPLLGEAWDGLLVISSADAARFEASMGTELLCFLRDVVSLALTPSVTPATA